VVVYRITAHFFINQRPSILANPMTVMIIRYGGYHAPTFAAAPVKMVEIETAAPRNPSMHIIVIIIGLLVVIYAPLEVFIQVISGKNFRNNYIPLISSPLKNNSLYRFDCFEEVFVRSYPGMIYYNIENC